MAAVRWVDKLSLGTPFPSKRRETYLGTFFLPWDSFLPRLSSISVAKDDLERLLLLFSCLKCLVYVPFGIKPRLSCTLGSPLPSEAHPPSELIFIDQKTGTFVLRNMEIQKYAHFPSCFQESLNSALKHFCWFFWIHQIVFWSILVLKFMKSFYCSFLLNIFQG